jgi:Flp pilus assembly protein TadG
MAVFFAVVLVGLIGMSGLGIDYGFATLERRSLQNAADAAATTGALDLVRNVSPVTDVNTMASRNATTTGVQCDYVDASNTVTGPCTPGPASTTSGVRVIATNVRDTYFMRVLGVPTISVSAESIARVSSMQNTTVNPATSAPTDAGNALFIVCGYDTKVYGGGTMDILQGSMAAPASSPWNVDAAAWGVEFIIHDAQVTDCGMQSNKFKGLNGTVGTVTLPAVLDIENGNKAGPTRTAVNGPQGCGVGLDSDGALGCVMILPVAISSPAKEKLYSVRWLPFFVRQRHANQHTGQLLSTYNLNDPLLSWTYAGGNRSPITSVRLAR